MSLAVLYEGAARRAAGHLGFPLDDSWIHLQFARNLASGRGFSYSDERWVSGSTAPLWTLLESILFRVAPNPILVGKVLGIVVSIGAVMAAARLARAVSGHPFAGLAAACVVALLPAAAWGAVSGMELPLSTLLVLLGASLVLEAIQTRREPNRGMAVLAFACLARPENLVVFGLTAAWAASRAEQPRLMARRGVIAAALLALVMAPWVVFSYSTVGRPLPTTFYAKSGPGLVRALERGDVVMARTAVVTHGGGGVSGFARTVVDQQSVVSLLAAGGLAWALWRRRPGAGWLALILVATPFAMGLIAPQRVKPDNFRYVSQLLAVVGVLAAAGLSAVHRSLPRLAVAMLIVACALLTALSFRKAADYALSVRNIEELHVTMGRWVAAHVPEGALVAGNDVGALAYFGNHRILDLEGLVSPEVLRFRDGQANRGLRTVMDRKPDYLVISPSWYPDIVADVQSFPELHRHAIRDNVAAGDAVMVVLGTPWTRLSLIGRGVVAEDRSR